MSEPKVDSWWIGLDRDDFAKEVAAHVEGWQRQKIGLLDTIGARIARDGWEPRKPRTHPRGPL